MPAKLDPCFHVVEYATHAMDATIVVSYRKRGEEAGVSNLKAGVEDGMVLSGFQDNSVDVVTCTWGLESMPDHKTPLHVRISLLLPLRYRSGNVPCGSPVENVRFGPSQAYSPDW